MNRWTLSSFVVATALLSSSTAQAATVVLSPLANVQGADAKRVDGIRQLMSSELEFSPGVDNVKELSNANDITDACLTDPRCLAGIAQRAGGDQLLTGKVTPQGGNFALDLVFYDGQTIARRRQFSVPNDSTAMANQMTPIVQEMLTGVNPQASGGAAADDFADIDDLPEEDDGLGMVAAPIPTAPPPQPAYAPPPPQPAYAPPPQPTYAAPPPQPAYAPPPQPAPVSDADAAGMITFGASAAEISAEEVDQMIQFGAPSEAAPAPAPAYAPPPQPTYAAPPPQPAYAPPPQPAYAPPPQPAYTAPAPQPQYGAPNPYAQQQPPPQPQPANQIQNLDAEPSGRSRGTVERDIASTMQITARGGYAKYFAFDFATVGAEVAVPVAGGLHLLAGLEIFAVNRTLPLELQAVTGIQSEWNTIFPINLGGMYKFTTPSIVQPYVGADVIFVQYYKDEIGADWAGGARARGGADFMLIDNFGLNLNLAVGGWSGKNWSLIEDGVGQSGLLPQVSAGTVIAF